MSRFLLLLAACTGDVKPTPSPTDTGPFDSASEGEGETGETSPAPALYDVSGAEIVVALPWSGGAIPFGGYAATVAAGGFYVADPLGDGTDAYVYRLPWGETSAPTIEDAADRLITLGYLGPDKLGTSGDLVAVPDADADVGDIPSAGIGYLLAEPSAGGAVADLATYAVQGGYEGGYTGRLLILDADGDGSADDLIATATVESGDAHGALAVYLDAEPGSYAWSEADYVLPACYEVEGATVAYGPVDLALDASGDHLWVACPSTRYVNGLVERWDLPLSADAAPYGGVTGPGGWTVAADPRGGVWMGSAGGVVMYAPADLSDVLELAPEDGGDLFGFAPELVETSTGQILILVGEVTRSARSDGESARLAPLDLPPLFDPGDLPTAPPEAGESYSAVYLCDVTAGPSLDDCARYEVPDDQAVTCTGSVQGLVEREDGLWLASSGWEFGSGDGCGVIVRRLAL